MRTWIVEYAKSLGRRGWAIAGGALVTIYSLINNVFPLPAAFWVVLGLLIAQAWAWTSLRRERDEIKALLPDTEPRFVMLQAAIDEAVELERAIHRREFWSDARERFEAWEVKVSENLAEISLVWRDRFQGREAANLLPSLANSFIDGRRVIEYHLHTGRRCLQDLQKENSGRLWTHSERRERERRYLEDYGRLLQAIADRLVQIQDSPGATGNTPWMTDFEQDALRSWYSAVQTFQSRLSGAHRFPAPADWSDAEDRVSQRVIAETLRELEAE